MLDLLARLVRTFDSVTQQVTAYFRKSPTRARVWDFLVAVERHQTLRTASAMAFDLFLAIVPMLGLAGYAAARLLHSQPLAVVEGSRLLDLAPARLHEFIGRQVNVFAETDLAPLFMVSALWLSSAAFLTMIRVFEEVFECEPRSWFVTRGLAVLFAAVGLLGFLGAAAIGAFLTWQGFTSDEHQEHLARTLGFSPDIEALQPWSILAFVGSALGIAAYLAFIYRFSVVRKVRRRFFPGAAVATAIGLVGSFAFAYYATHLARYALFYGGLAAIVVILLWLWLWCSAILIGAEFNVALEGPCDPRAPEREAAPTQRVGAGPTHTPRAVGKPEGDWQS